MRRLFLFKAIFISICTLIAQEQNIKFFHLDMKDGLSNNEVNTIFKDSKGFLWVGTLNGLNKYDGYRFKVYKSEVGDSATLGGNSISGIVEDNSGQIWIGTDDGVCKYNRDTETFTRLKPQNKNSDALRARFAHTLLIDYKGYLWIFYNGSFEQIDTKTGKFVQLIKDKKALDYLNSKNISSAVEDSENNLWIGTWFGGLVKLDKNRESATYYNNFPSNTVISLFYDGSSNLWISSIDNGFCKFNTKSKQFDFLSAFSKNKNQPTFSTYISNDKLWISSDHSIIELQVSTGLISTTYIHDPNNPHSITPAKQKYIYKDNSGIIWIGSAAGISYYDPQRDKFSKFYYVIGNKKHEKYYAKSGIIDRNRNVWINTFGKGVYLFNPKNKSFSPVLNKSNGLASDFTSCICKLNTGDYWIATENGISIYDPTKNKIIDNLVHSVKNANSIYHNSIRKIFQDTYSNIWIITQESLDLLKNGKFIHFTKENLRGLSHYKINEILEDKDGNVWIGTYFGLNRYDNKTKSISKYLSSPNDKNSLSNSYIVSLFEDSNGTLWVSTLNGLNVYDKKTNTFKPFKLKDKNLSNLIHKICEDNSKNVWFLSSSAISILNLKTFDLKNYDNTDGINMNYECFFKDMNGRFYIGGAHSGIYIFNPLEIKKNNIIPTIIISKFSILNQEVKVEPKNSHAILQKNISETKKITLNYDQSVLEFELAALNYTLPKKNQYAYKLDGFDKEWVYLNPEKRTITYTNLNPGNYTLFVKGSNNDGLWNENGVSLEIEILPPFWRTTIAYIIYFLLLLGTLLVFMHYSLLRFKEKSLLELDQMKIRFFTNISHEFRTPLTLISGPLNKLMDDVQKGSVQTERMMKQLSLIERNSQRLLMLINQLLDMQKSEEGKLKLEPSHGDLILFLHNIFNVFSSIAEQKSISYLFEKDIESFETEFDADKMEKIIYNLLSNAFKFTKDKVILKIEIESTKVLVSVHDNGIGIAKQNLSKVFENFFQVDNHNMYRNQGSGIGLALARELVQLHKGTITVQSVLGEGTIMRVELPFLQKIATAANPIIIEPIEETESKNETEPFDETDYSPYAKDQEDIFDEHDRQKPLVLIVEDNPDLREYISDILNQNYRISEAENGKIGVEFAFKLLPDIIVSDIMMPQMDGNELCSILKEDERTSHIPIIMLTALSAISSQLKGYEHGADDYITKPFNADLLLARIKNLIEVRKQLQHKFQRSVFVNPADFVTNVSDEKLLKKAMELVESNLDNLDFAIPEFILGMNMSKTGIYKKIKVLTGQSVSEFIKSIRLRHAAQLLLRKEFTISEISYRVGFQNRTQFNRAFKEQFSMSPTEFIQSNLNS